MTPRQITIQIKGELKKKSPIDVQVGIDPTSALSEEELMAFEACIATILAALRAKTSGRN